MDFDDKANSGMDENLPANLANLWGLPAYEIPWIFDGGNLLVDSRRTLFCTNGLYLNNPAWPKAALHQDLKQYMGIEQVVILKPQHNDYWKHIDMQIKLLDDTTFVVSSVTPGYSPNYDSLEANYALLAALTAPNGKPYRIARLPHADNWKTYANALILNNRVIVPTYDHPLDSLALAIYGDLMPQHIVRGVNCNKIIGWEGALHCITMQLFDDEQIVSLKKQYAYASNLRLSLIPFRATAHSSSTPTRRCMAPRCLLCTRLRVALCAFGMCDWRIGRRCDYPTGFRQAPICCGYRPKTLRASFA